MSTHFEHELEGLKENLLAMASHAELAVSRSMKALLERDDDLARKVQDDDEVLDQFEIDIDDLAIRLLAKAPLASHLRLITVAMKISHDLERVGDEATSISRRVRQLNEEPQLKPYVDLPRMANLALQMLKEGIACFVERNPAKARSIIPRDKQVDTINKAIYKELAGIMAEKPAAIPICLHLMFISKSLERIADHATNIAEEIVFLYEGMDIRHDAEIKRGAPA